MHGRSSSRPASKRPQSPLSFELSFGLLVSERLFGFTRSSHRGERRLWSVTPGLSVLLRLSRRPQNRCLARVVLDHTLRRSPDLALPVRYIVVAAWAGLEDLDFAGGSPLHRAESVAPCLRVPEHGGFAAAAAFAATLPDSIEEP